MVKLLKISLILFCLLIATGYANEVIITAELENNKPTAQAPFNVLITIQHPANSAVDKESFKADQKLINVTLLREIPVGSDQKLIVSMYQWQMPGRDKGLYTLPAIEATVGNKKYSSTTTTFEVFPEQPADEKSAPVQKIKAPKTSFIKLEAFVSGPTTLYPGQRTSLVYRYYFNDSIALSKEQLPFLNPNGLTTIGETQIRNAEEGSLSASEVLQRVEAVTPGTFTLGPSHVEGFVWRTDSDGKRIYLEPPLSADAAAVTITVLPFPEEGKPASFNGAVGDFNFTTRIMGPTEVSVGDKLSLALEITGNGQLETVPMPDLCCQPGFPGNFKLGDIPPVGVYKNGTKYFVAELWPLHANLKAMPPVEFSFLNPETKQYQTVKSQPLPIIVHPADAFFNNILQEDSNVQKNFPLAAPESTAAEVASYENNWLLNLLYLIVPVGMAYVIYLIIKQPKGMPQQVNVKTISSSESSVSKSMLHRAEENIDDQPKFYYYLQQALMNRLVEIGQITDANIPPQKLSTIGIQGQVRFLLTDMEQRRFANKDELPAATYLAQAVTLYNSMHAG